MTAVPPHHLEKHWAQVVRATGRAARLTFRTAASVALPAAAAMLVVLSSRPPLPAEPPPRATTYELNAARAAGPVSTAALGARCIGPTFDDTPAFQAAIDTGHTVYAPALGGECHITHALVMRTPGQIFHGDGRARTRIVIHPGFVGAGVFVAATGEPGPAMRDFSVSFVQPDSETASDYHVFVPAFLFAATPAFQIAHLGCYRATTCLDMTANSGKSLIEDLEFSAFSTGIVIDGSLDTVRITDPHWWPFELTAKQRSLFDGNGKLCPVGITSGRMDDLVIRGGLFGGCLGLLLKRGEAGGVTSGSIDGTSFDTFSGISMLDGTLNIATTTFSLGTPRSQAIHLQAGIMAVSASYFLAGADLEKPMIDVVSSNGLNITGSNFLLGGRDVVAVRQGGGLLSLMSCTFERDPKSKYIQSALELDGGQASVIGNIASHREGPNAWMVRVARDNRANRVIGNSFPGWNTETPANSVGTYLWN